MPPDGMTSNIVRSSTYFQWLDSNGASVARSLIIRRDRMGPSSSRTLETIAVREIGLKSPLPVMGVTLGWYRT